MREALLLAGEVPPSLHHGSGAHSSSQCNTDQPRCAERKKEEFCRKKGFSPASTKRGDLGETKEDRDRKKGILGAGNSLRVPGGCPHLGFPPCIAIDIVLLLVQHAAGAGGSYCSCGGRRQGRCSSRRLLGSLRAEDPQLCVTFPPSAPRAQSGFYRVRVTKADLYNRAVIINLLIRLFLTRVLPQPSFCPMSDDAISRASLEQH